MQRLPAVKDDNKTVRTISQMLQISEENTFLYENINHDKMNAVHEEFLLIVKALTKKLTKKTGVGN